MKRTLIALAIVVLAVLLLAAPGLVAAKGGNGGGHGRGHGGEGQGGWGHGAASFSLLGTVLDFSCEDPGYIKVDVVAPSHYGDEVTMQTDDNTAYKQCTFEPGEGEPSSCEALVTLPTVRIMGTVDGNTFLAKRVIIQYTPPAE